MVGCLVGDPSNAGASTSGLAAIARACSPRVACYGTDAVLFDAHGLSSVIGPPAAIARTLLSLARDRELAVRVALASTNTAAWLLAHAIAGPSIVAPGQEAAALAPLPVRWLGALVALDAPASADDVPRHAAIAHARRAEAYRERLAIFERWGLRTLGDLAALPRSDLHARLGPVGARCHQAACGEDAAPLVPAAEPVAFADRVELEWPIEGLEPLSFVLAPQCDRLSAALERADRGAVEVRTSLRLTTRATHVRVLHLPAPMRDARVLRTLILLDLESHPPAAAIDAVDLALEVTPGRILQGALFTRALPSTEDLATLTARLHALMGETRVGRPVLVDSHDARVIGMQPFQVPATDHVRPGAPSSRERAPIAQAADRPQEAGSSAEGALVVRPSLRRFRLPVAARVVAEHGRPVHVVPSAKDLVAGRVVTAAGPWRTSGGWWTLGRAVWDRDEWDVELAGGGVYRMARHRHAGTWEIEGVFD